MSTKEKPTIDPEAMARTLDPERVQRDFDAAMDALQRPTPETFFTHPRPKGGAPSPWATGGAAEIDRGALPSALLPAAEERPVTKAAGSPRAWPGTWKLVAGFAAVALAAPLLVVLAGQRVTKPERVAPSTTAAPAAPSPATAPSAEVVMGAAPGATAAPSATATPASSATPSAPPRKLPLKPHATQEPPQAPPPPSAAPPSPPPSPTFFE